MEKISNQELLEKIYTQNEDGYNEDKLLEELIELSEVMIKRRVKKGTPKEPPMQAYVDEIGDVLIRLSIVMMDPKLSILVGKRKEDKLAKLRGYFESGKYKGRV